MNFKWIYFLPLFLSLFFVAGKMQGQTKGSIKGVCRDAVTNEVLIGANILIEGTGTGNSTDLDGAYIINSISPGTYTLVASYVGYEEAKKEVTVESGKTITVDFNLQTVSFLGKEVVITAQAEGQVAAINRQLASKTITNIVSARKIQEIPVANAAEAVGRLPGVSIQRSGGEGNKVVVRGLSPEFNNIQIEGAKMAATGSNDRSSDLSMISPYMLEGIEVSKAAMPDKEADVIGGSVNFVLRGAPDEKRMDVLLQTGYNSLKNKFGDYKFVVGGSSRFFGKKLGIFGQLDVEKRNRSSYELNVKYFNATSPDNQEDVDVSVNNLLVKDINRDIKRYGGVVVLDYRLPNGKIKFSNFASAIDKNITNRFENLRPFYKDHYYGLENNRSNLFVMNNTLRVKNNFHGLTLDAGLTYAVSNNELPDGYSFLGREDSAFGEGVDITKSPKEIAGFAKNDIENAIVYDYFHNQYDTKEIQKSADVNLEYTLSITDKINVRLKTGGKYRALNKSYDKEARRIPINWGGEIAGSIRKIIHSFPEKLGSVDPNASQLPYGLFIDEDYQPDNFLGGDYTIKNIPDFDFVAQINELMRDSAYVDYPGSLKNDYSGDEKYAAGYFLTEFNIGKKITFTPGFRYERNETTYKGVRGNSATLRWIEGYNHSDTTTTRANAFFLPMIHLHIKPVDWFDIRMAYTKTLARPNYNKIIPFWERTLEIVHWNNPDLKPAHSTNVDFYTSFHSNKFGLLTVGGFYKKIEDLVYSTGLAAIVDATEYGLPADDAGKRILRFINNPYPVDLYGLEAEWQTRFWYLGEFFEGLIFNVNYTRTFSEVKYPQTKIKTSFIQEPPYILTENIDTFYTDRLILQPDDILNVTLGYDIKGFSIRGSLLYQNDIFAATNFWEKHRATSDKYIRFDLSMKQKIKIKGKDGLEAVLNWSNINAAIERDINEGTGFPVKEQHYGSVIDIGLRYRL